MIKSYFQAFFLFCSSTFSLHLSSLQVSYNIETFQSRQSFLQDVVLADSKGFLA